MFILTGKTGLSEFHNKKLTNKINDKLVKVEKLSSKFFYTVEVLRELAPEKKDVLEKLLDASVQNIEKSDFSSASLWINPRFGTRSPWSTKALDITHRCGLTDITRIERGLIWSFFINGDQALFLSRLLKEVYDPMTQSVVRDYEDLKTMFHSKSSTPIELIDILRGGINALHEINQRLGLALSNEECEILYDGFRNLNRNPTDVELMMFAQVNSEHCRHKIFNSKWSGDEVRDNLSLFQMIKTTNNRHGQKTIVAYKDNAAVIKGFNGSWFFPNGPEHEYGYQNEPAHLVLKVETHNHPTAISPAPGAATGAGGEIRDEGATGRGGKPKAGVVGFCVSDLRVPG